MYRKRYRYRSPAQAVGHFDPVGVVAGHTIFDFRSTLKDRLHTIRDTCRAQIVKGLIICFRQLKAIHDETGLRFVQFVACYVGLKIIHLTDALLKRRQLQLQVDIRKLRISYLFSELAQSHFQIGISSRLRFLEKSLDGLEGLRGFVSGGERFSGGIDQLIEGVEIEVQRHFSQKTNLSKSLRLVR